VFNYATDLGEISVASQKKTKCPNTANWLDEYYDELQTEFISMTAGDESSNDSLNSKFIGFSVGCNKGFDALNTLRMGTFDATLDKAEWNKAMSSGKTMHGSVCAQDVTLPFVVNDKIKQRRDGEVHCFEPMPSTFQQLKHSASSLGYDQKGFNVIHGAVSQNEGIALFKSATKGIENVGLGNSEECIDGGCEEVAVHTIDKYVSDHIESNAPIHILQIDVEGFDGDVLLGASEVLKRVEYLEFEYNWMGSWKKQHLYDMVEMLNDRKFTCYFEGDRRLWRITGCWMQYFDIHHWSNVACVNRERVPKLATKMENVFQETLKEDVPKLPLDDENDVYVLSTDPVMMASKYAKWKKKHS
jgi:FkbM family methyltransferase